MSFALDHDYCKVISFEEDNKTDFSPESNKLNKEESKMALEKQLPVEVDVCGEPTNSDGASSSSSPAHSMDSGVDAGMDDFLVDFPSTWREELQDFSLNDEDLRDLEALLRENIPANEHSVEKDAKHGRYGSLMVLNPTTKANVQMVMPNEKKLSEEEIEKNKRNAIAARENRQKKKKYMQGLENDVAKLKEENMTLKTRNESMTIMLKKLSDEVKYLRSVLANESTISLLIKSVAATPGISLTSSLLPSSEIEEAEKETAKADEGKKYCTRSKKRQASEMVGVTPSKRTRSSTSSGGVCLHVNHGKVSLEFCAKCEMKASRSGVL